MAGMETDVQFMGWAIRLAMGGRGLVEPNPMVGCVIVKDGRIIAEGFHQRFGTPHAEINALAGCKESPEGASVYVTLEPCCHVGKQTPPCVPKLLEAKVKRVVIGCADPNPAVNGKGAAMLKQKGVEVVVGVMELQAKQLAAPYIKQVGTGRPYVTLKWAQSADGKLAGPGPKRVQISNPASLGIVQDLRAASDCVMVGIGTVLSDDPLLTVRDVTPVRSLARIVLDSQLKIPLNSRLVQTAGEVRLAVFCAAGVYFKEEWRKLESAGVIVEPVSSDADGLSLGEILDYLGQRNVTHLLVEGGAKLLGSFLRQNLADRVWVFSSPMIIGQAGSPAAPTVDYPTTGQADVGEDTLTEYLNPSSPAFFALQQSADFVDVIE